MSAPHTTHVRVTLPNAYAVAISPAQAAVLEAAKAWAEAQVTLTTDKERESAGLAVITAVRTLRAQEGE